MNLNELQRKLIAAARATQPEDRVPYAFEKRIMARLEGQTALDSWGLWGRALSRAAICSVAFVILLAASTYFVPSSGTTDKVQLSQDVDQTLFAAVAVDNTADQDN
jgi:hypothetical protein